MQRTLHPRWIATLAVGWMLCLTTPLLGQQTRTWKDASGKFSVEAKFVAQEAGTVRLKTVDGRTIAVPKARLSQTDIRYLASLDQPPGASDVSPAAAGGTRTAGDAEQRLTAKLDGPAVPGKASESLPTFLSRLDIPFFIDKRSFNEAGLTPQVDVPTDLSAPTLAAQLDAVLASKELAWYRLRTVLVISHESVVREQVAEVLAYRLPTDDFASVRKKLEQVEPRSWESLGGPGSASPLPGFVVIRQSPIVHRQLIEALQTDPLPHRYVHPLDNRVVDIELSQGTLVEFADQLATHLEQEVLIAKSVADAGISTAQQALNLNGVSAADALELVLGQLDCTWREKPASLEITTAAAAAGDLERQRLAIPFGSPRNAATTLAVVQKACTPDSWQPLGGNGQIQHAGGQNFVVAQSPPVMRELKQLIADVSGSRRN